MRTLSTPINTLKDAAQGAWCEVYDIYLKTAVTVPGVGSTSVLRLTDCPGGITFFKPKISPEASFGAAQVYTFYPIRRALVRSESKFALDKMQIISSNVSADWSAVLASIDWYDTPVIIRKVPIGLVGATADDCAVLWSGLVDAVKFKERTLAADCSSDLVALNVTAPRENQHVNCRFAWGDDQCTSIRFLLDNYRSGLVCGDGCTVTTIGSDDFALLLKDEAVLGAGYGTDLVDGLADADITASSEGTNWTAHSLAVNVVQDVFGLGSGVKHGFSRNDPVQLATSGSMPAGYTAGVTYYVIPRGSETFNLAAAADGPALPITTTGSSVTLTALNNTHAAAVKNSATGYWKLGDVADWGTETDGYFQIPDAQAGRMNAELKPWITFDFGAPTKAKVWRISSVAGVRLEELVRMLVFFSSSNGSTWHHETYFEMPPAGGVFYDVLIPTASSKRYWRICVRSRWAEPVFYTLLDKVCAYTNARHWWKGGRVTFASNTTTVALRGLSRPVLESYGDAIVFTKLPVAPVLGDTFSLERGCPRTWNACCERQNWENFGGSLDLPYQQVIR